MATVDQMFKRLSEGNATVYNALIDYRLGSALSLLSERYRQLAIEVLLRLPENWDSHVSDWAVTEGTQDDIPDYSGIRIDRFLACALMLDPEEEEDFQEWHIILATDALHNLSDAAVRAVIVHEFGHIACGIPPAYGVYHESVSDDRADTMAGWWGFGPELEKLTEELRTIRGE